MKGLNSSDWMVMETRQWLRSLVVLFTGGWVGGATWKASVETLFGSLPPPPLHVDVTGREKQMPGLLRCRRPRCREFFQRSPRHEKDGQQQWWMDGAMEWGGRVLDPWLSQPKPSNLAPFSYHRHCRLWIISSSRILCMHMHEHRIGMHCMHACMHGHASEHECISVHKNDVRMQKKLSWWCIRLDKIFSV